MPMSREDRNFPMATKRCDLWKVHLQADALMQLALKLGWVRGSSSLQPKNVGQNGQNQSIKARLGILGILGINSSKYQGASNFEPCKNAEGCQYLWGVPYLHWAQMGIKWHQDRVPKNIDNWWVGLLFFPLMLRKKGLAWSTTKHIFDSERGRRESPCPMAKSTLLLRQAGVVDVPGWCQGWSVSHWDIWSLLAGFAGHSEGCWLCFFLTWLLPVHPRKF